MNEWTVFIGYMAVFVAIFYFFIISPRKKQDKKHKDLLASISRGDKIVTIGGIKAEISKVKEDSIIIKINENTQMEILKSAVAYKAGEEKR